MARIFLSFRKADERLTRDRIYRALVDRFGAEQIFKSRPSIPGGADYSQVLVHQAESCELMVVLIGPAWFGTLNTHGLAHLYEEDDWVRREIATSLKAGNRIVPVLLGEGTMLPAPEILTPDIAVLGRLQFVRIADSEVEAGITELISTLLWLQPALEPEPEPRVTASQVAVPEVARDGAGLDGADAQAGEGGQAISVRGGGLAIAVGTEMDARGARIVAGDDYSRTVNKKGGALGALTGVAVGAGLEAAEASTGPGPTASAGAGAIPLLPGPPAEQGGAGGGLRRWARLHQKLAGTLGGAAFIGVFAAAAGIGALRSDNNQPGSSDANLATETQVTAAQQIAPSSAGSSDSTSAAASASPTSTVGPFGVAGIPAAGTDTMTMEDLNQNTWIQTVTFGAPELGTAPGTAGIQQPTDGCIMKFGGTPSENIVIPFSVTVDLTSTEPLTDFTFGIYSGDATMQGAGAQVVGAYEQNGSMVYYCLGVNSEYTAKFDRLDVGVPKRAQFWVVVPSAIDGAGQANATALAATYITVGNGQVKGTVTGSNVCGGSGLPNLLITGLTPPTSTSTSSPDSANCTFSGGA